MPASDPLSFISSALAPVVSLSVCAILASNAQSQYSSIVDRIRDLNHEQRDLGLVIELSETQAARVKSLRHQIPVLYRRTRFLRNAIFLIFLGMSFILLTSFMIVMGTAFSEARWLAAAAKWTFFFGLVYVFTALICLLNEVQMAFRVVRYELGHYDRSSAREAEKQFRDY